MDPYDPYDPNDRGSGAIDGGQPQQVMLSGREYERYLCGALNEPWASQLLPDGDRAGWLRLQVRADGTYDYRYSDGKDDAWTARVLRHIASQIKAGAHLQDPSLGSDQ